MFEDSLVLGPDKDMGSSSPLKMIILDFDIYLMSHKFKALEKFKEFWMEVEKQFGKNIKASNPIGAKKSIPKSLNLLFR